MAQPQGADRVRVELELVVGGDPVAGVVDGAPGGPRPFSGWLALMSLLDELRRAPDDGAR